MAEDPSENTVTKLLLDLNRKQDDQTEKLHSIDINYTKLSLQFEDHMEQDRLVAKRIDNIDEKLGEYNHQLSIHIAGVQELKKITSNTDNRVATIDKRVDSLEAPRRALGTAKKLLLELGKVAAGAAAIYGVLKLIFPHM